ncbi:hypothetical protein GCM10009557_07980 [Virgisporangium ochraceum]|uniref:Interferon-induced transmembrane protein n=1 Tax=Virgisporangium ochraceum TaxID=65505 RepID=A0A8J4EAB2_9ACTN|nr:CD225/dispanin family protein [Virgisporangium ochraceum]GIJ67344.1 hypothetical protein Voc01_022610 [Virgisporangium ochraceum]
MTYVDRPDAKTRLWLGLAAAAMLLCQPAGIVAVIFVALAMRAEKQDDHADTVAKLRTAKTWTIVGFALGIPATALYIAYVVFVFSQATSSG